MDQKYSVIKWTARYKISPLILTMAALSSSLFPQINICVNGLTSWHLIGHTDLYH